LRLKELANEQKIVLLLSDVVAGEIKQHIKRNVTDARSALRKVFKAKLQKQGYESWCAGKDALAILKRSSEEKYSVLFDVFDLLNTTTEEEMINEAISLFETFILESKAHVIDSSSVNCAKILADYFNSRPPFEETENKKREFPDAFMMAKIQQYAQEHGKVFVVSDDRAFLNIKSQEIEVLGSLEEFLRIVNPYEDWIVPVKSFLEEISQREQINILTRDKIFDINPYVDGEDCDRQGVVSGFQYEETNIDEVRDINFTFSGINLVSENYAMILLECEAYIHAEGIFYDDSRAIWDSEDKEYLYRPYGCANEVHKVEFEAILKIETENETQRLIGVSDIQFDFTLDQDSRISQQFTFNEDEVECGFDPVAEHINHKSFACPNCSCTLEIKALSEYMECVSSNEGGMDADWIFSFCDGGYSDCCPACHSQLRIIGEVREYPAGVVDNDNLEIELIE